MVKTKPEQLGPEPDPFVVNVLGELSSVSFPYGEMLDVGCGDGRNAAYAAQLGWTVTGVDPVFRLSEHTQKSIRFVEGSLPQLPFEDGTFNLVVCTSVLPILDIATRKKSILEIMRIARSGGAVALNCIVREDDTNRGGFWNYESLRLPFDTAKWDVRAVPEPIKRLGTDSIIRSLHTVLAFKP